MSDKATQNERILKHLRAGRSLTGLEALRLFGTLSFSRRISELRAQGHKIQTELIRRGGKTFGRYSLEAK